MVNPLVEKLGEMPVNSRLFKRTGFFLTPKASRLAKQWSHVTEAQDLLPNNKTEMAQTHILPCELT